MELLSHNKQYDVNRTSMIMVNSFGAVGFCADREANLLS